MPTNVPVAERYETWLDWKKGFDIAAAVCVPQLSEQQKTRLLFTSVGMETQKIIRLLGLPPSNKYPWAAEREFSDLSMGLNKFFRAMVDESVDHARFHECKQEAREGIHDYAMRLKRLATGIDIDPASFSFRHQMLKGMRNKDLAMKAADDNIPLGDVIQTAARKEQREASESGKRLDPWQMLGDPQPMVAAVSTDKEWKGSRPMKRQAPSEAGSSAAKGKPCRYCGGRSHPDKRSCPAFGKDCRSCGLKNHFEKVCEKKKMGKVNAVASSDGNNSPDYEKKVQL